VRKSRAVLYLAFLFAGLVLLHMPLLRLPYFWDEAGYYIPAARDFYLHHQLIPTSTLTNAHPPLPSVYLACAWWLFGYAPIVARCAMLLVATLALLAVFRIGRRLQNETVAWATVASTALYPIWFAQSSLAHADLLAACFVLWGLAAYFDKQRWTAALLFSLAVLSKETALLFPLVLAAWERAAPHIPKLRRIVEPAPNLAGSLALLFPALPLAAWFEFHYLRTGYIFGNPEFVRYNLQTTHEPLRILFALLHRAWHLFGHMNLFVLTVLGLVAMAWPAVRDKKSERPRIAIPAQLVIAALVVANWVAFSIVGGALLARYLLPIYPLVILIWISTFWRRWKQWWIAVAVVIAAFLAALVWNPHYRYSPEDNLAYADYIRLHQGAASFIEHRLPHAIVLTAWTGTDELTTPWLGYVQQPVRVVPIENFSAGQILSAAQNQGAFDAAFVFSTKYDPGPTVLSRLRVWEQRNEQYFGFHQDLPPETIAQLLGGKIVWQQHKGAQWAAVIIFPRVMNG
jgi:4-amino-4-deoxy-L-arabinose transferase-like glycosyltransferase